MSIEEQFAELLPESWQLSNLVFLNPEWQVNATDGEYVVVATGLSITEALDNAYLKVDAGIYIGRLALLDRIHREPVVGTLDLRSLGLSRPKPKIERRI